MYLKIPFQPYDAYFDILCFFEYMFNPTTVRKVPRIMPIIFMDAISKELVNNDKSHLDNAIPIKTTGGTRATDIAIPVTASIMSGQKKANVPASPEKKATKK